LSRQKVSHNFTKIVLKALRTNLFYIVLSLTFLTSGFTAVYSQEVPKKIKSKPTVKQKDSLKINPKDLVKKEAIVKDDSVKPKKAALESIVRRKAVDYERIDQKTKIVTLYNQAELYYEDIELKSGIIVLDYSKNEVYAGRIKDKNGKYTQYPVFKQGANEVQPDSIRFNFKTKKALVWNSRTKQGEMNIIAEKSKKENDSVYFMERAKITTAKDINNPEYYFLARKAKFVPGKKVVVGPTNMYIADVPTPIGLPFAFFPMTSTAQSGVIIPTFQDTNLRGYSLQNGGYYFALSQNYDLTFLGDYYTNGSYAIRLETNYARKYKFSGNLNFRYENQITSERGFPDYAKRNEYNIQWSHQQDGKSNPDSRFSASVNLGSSTYFRNSLNIVNNSSQLNNTLSSSVNYSKTFNSVPMVNMSLTATHSQNTSTKTINMTLPTFQASVDRIFPFASDEAPKKGFIKNMNFQYSVNAQNSVVTTDSLFFKPQMFKDLKNGIQHTIPLSTNFKVLKHFSFTTSVNYNEVWYFKTERREFNTSLNKVVTSDVQGFDAFRTYNFSSSVGTTIYGTFNFGKNSKIKSIRHTIRPNIGYNYQPSFDRYFDNYTVDATGRQERYTRFDSGIYNGPSSAFSSIITMSINNIFEAKVVDKDTTKTELKKVMLINNLSFSTTYNLGTKILEPLQVSGGTLLFKDKMNVNFGVTLDPYALDNSGSRIPMFNINNGGSFFRLTGANMAMNYTLASSKDEDKTKNKKNTEQGLRNGGRDDDLFGTSVDLSDRRQSQFGDKDEDAEKFEGFYKTKMPWDLNMAYSLGYSNRNRENQIATNSLMLSGNLQLTPKWRIGASSGYDFVQKGITATTLRFERDLLSWRMDFNWNPIGINTFWGFFIGIKSGVLSDIKWDKRKIDSLGRQ
jgi:lipopolysaccharide assembly outer membrane protein LptD (OstA)